MIIKNKIKFDIILEEQYLRAKYCIFKLQNRKKRNWFAYFGIMILKPYLKFLHYSILLFKRNDASFKILREDLFHEFCDLLEKVKTKKKPRFSRFFLKVEFWIFRKLQNTFSLLKDDVFATVNEALDRMDEYKSDDKLEKVKQTITKIKNKNQVDENSLLELEKELFEYNKYKKKKAAILSISTVSTLVIAVLSITFVSTILFPQAMKIRAASYGFTQTDWSGGASSTAVAFHNGDQTGWTYYYSKDGVSTTTNGQLSLDFTAVDRRTETSNVDWQMHATTSTYYLNGSVGVMKPNGVMCSVNSECISGYCVDGYCCNNACSTACQSCSASGQEGTCTGITSNEGKSCTGVCTSCVAGTCTNRTAEDTTEGCASNCYDCVAGSCTTTSDADDGSCTGACSSCVAGVCTNSQADTQPSGCNSTCQFCDGSGACKTMTWVQTGYCYNGWRTGNEDQYCRPSTTGIVRYAQDVIPNCLKGLTTQANCSGGGNLIYFLRCTAN